jgi:hypothetical protein
MLLGSILNHSSNTQTKSYSGNLSALGNIGSLGYYSPTQFSYSIFIFTQFPLFSFPTISRQEISWIGFEKEQSATSQGRQTKTTRQARRAAESG